MYSSFSKKHLRRLIANNTASDLINTMSNISNNFVSNNSSSDSIDNNIVIENSINKLDSKEMNKSLDELVQCNESLEELINEEIQKSSSNSIESLHELIDSNTDDLDFHDELGESDREESVDFNYENTEYNLDNIKGNEIAETHVENQFLQNISSWAIMFNIFHSALLALLFILRKYTHYPFPKDPRTLLKTPRRTEILEMGTGEYCTEFWPRKCFEKYVR